MIDWITAVVPFPHALPIYGGGMVCFDENGELKWKRDSFRQLEGSWESSAVAQTFYRNDPQHGAVHQLGMWCQEVWISGNPAKFLQGHNLFGSDNLTALAPAFFKAVLEAVGLEVTPFQLHRWERGEYQLDRVDIAYMVDVGGQQEVRDVLAALAHQATYAHRGRGVFQAGTVGWGKRTSRLDVLKCYDKHAEVTGRKSHLLPADLPFRSEIENYALGKVRIEVELHSKYLEKNHLRQGQQWHTDTPEHHWNKAMSKLNLAAQIPLNPLNFDKLPTRLKKTYVLWESGRDVRSMMNRKTYSRHRKELMAACAIDICQPRNLDVQPKVVQLHKVISAVPAGIPAWAYGTPILKAA